METQRKQISEAYIRNDEHWRQIERYLDAHTDGSRGLMYAACSPVMAFYLGLFMDGAGWHRLLPHKVHQAIHLIRGNTRLEWDWAVSLFTSLLN